MDKNGVPLNYGKIMYSDSIATCTGAIFGTSTVTTFVESGAGIATGGKTGFASVITAIILLFGDILSRFWLKVKQIYCIIIV
jgi:AGZA family xanthine/uracil permease-like MFS transporter